MKRGFVIVALITPFLYHCDPCPTPGSRGAQAKDAANQAGYAVAKGMLGPFAGPEPASAGGPEDGDCRQLDVEGPDDAYAIAGISSAPTATCAGPVTGYGDCAACATTWCCAESVACFSEGKCTCLMAQRTPGVDWPAEVPCGEPDDFYQAEIACITDHCAKECPAK